MGIEGKFPDEWMDAGILWLFFCFTFLKQFWISLSFHLKTSRLKLLYVWPKCKFCTCVKMNIHSNEVQMVTPSASKNTNFKLCNILWSSFRIWSVFTFNSYIILTISKIFYNKFLQNWIHGLLFKVHHTEYQETCPELYSITR